VYVGYFLVIRPPDDENDQPIWIAQAITTPNSNPNHPNYILIQYWTSTSIHYVDAQTFEG